MANRIADIQENISDVVREHMHTQSEITRLLLNIGLLEIEKLKKMIHEIERELVFYEQTIRIMKSLEKKHKHGNATDNL